MPRQLLARIAVYWTREWQLGLVGPHCALMIGRMSVRNDSGAKLDVGDGDGCAGFLLPVQPAHVAAATHADSARRRPPRDPRLLIRAADCTSDRAMPRPIVAALAVGLSGAAAGCMHSHPPKTA